MRPDGLKQARLELPSRERSPDLPDLDAFETIAWDYNSAGLSAQGHPLALVREELRSQGLPDARTLNAQRDGSRVHYAGLVICRQRPGTASGVVFMTLEDESGFVNLVIWSRVFDENAVFLKTTHFLGVTGKLQVEDGVAHVIAESFWVPQVDVHPERVKSRDFH